MQVYHLTFSTDGRMPMVSDEESRRRVVARLGEITAGSLVLFCLVDDHLHVVVWVDDPPGRIARAIVLGIRPLCDTTVEAAFVRTVDTRSHLRWLAENYIIAQPKKHGLGEHPALYTGSCLQDLMGARAGSPLVIREVLPRFNLSRALKPAGLATPPRPLATDRLLSLGASTLIAAAAAATCAPPSMIGQRAPAVRARLVAAHLARRAGMSHREVLHALGISRSGLRRLLLRPSDPDAEGATLVRLSLEQTLRTVRA